MTGKPISRRRCLSLGAAGLGLAAFRGEAMAAAQAEVVVELFTSQACSSCAAADSLFSDIRAMPGVLALTFHVDYWDYLGWKDTLASSEFSQRQYDYAKARGDMDVFTPQIIVNGGRQLPGSQRETVLTAINEARGTRRTVPLSISDAGQDLAIELGSSAPAEKATLWIMAVQEQATAEIEKGELAGREITYHNVVRKLVPQGQWDGKTARFMVAKDKLLTQEASSCVALLQRGAVGPVLACASWGPIVS